MIFQNIINKSQILIPLFIFIFVQNCGADPKTDKNPFAKQVDVQGEFVGNLAMYDEDSTDKLTRLNQANNQTSNSRRNAVTSAVAYAAPAIVGINVTEVHQVQYRNQMMNDPFFRRFFRSRTQSRTKLVKGLGSGFIVSSDGFILTNHHVAGNASKIVVTLTNGEKYDAEIVGADKVSDVCLLKINETDLPYLKLGDSDDLITGEWVIALGNPFGLFDMNAKPTITVGVISNYGVSFMNDSRVYKNMIQTDAAISSGNSGGPLVNAAGEVIGMNTVIFSTAQTNQGSGSIGIGFSIPINRVIDILDKLKNHGTINRDFSTGIDVVELNENIARLIKTDREEGVVVNRVFRGSEGEKTGFLPGDIILKIDDCDIKKAEDYNIAVADGIAGDKHKFTILRNDKLMYIDLYYKPNKRKKSGIR
ncbi:MAG: trypsin-like peptidase domain-containing protein [Chlorobi bacterium]|nr:trypsin-like peptidase domain-containing protein [Chlorobiota bacterium]